eukprot:COSAG01_NODE_4615_length_4877_cov_52.080185_2_plen_905_part_00
MGSRAVALSSQDELVAMADSTGPLRIRELLPRVPVIYPSFSMPCYGNQDGVLVAGKASAQLIVLASSSRIVALARRSNSTSTRVIWDVNVPDTVTCMTALSADHRLFACVVRDEEHAYLALHTTDTGKRKHRVVLSDFAVSDLRFSLDSQLIVVSVECRGVLVVDCISGVPKYGGLLAVTSGHVHGTAVDARGRFLFTAASPGQSLVRDLASGSTLREFPFSDHSHMTIAIDDRGERVAFTAILGGMWTKMTIADVDGLKPIYELQRDNLPATADWMFMPRLEFSPGKGEYLLVKECGGLRWCVVRAADGQQPPWSKCLVEMALPDGPISKAHILHSQSTGIRDPSVTWVRPDPQDVDSSLQIQCIVNNQLHVIDVTAFIRSWTEDGNFTLDQLYRLSARRPEFIPLVIERWPHVVDQRDPRSGDTVLHRIMSIPWLDGRTNGRIAIENWTNSQFVRYKLLSNFEGVTALAQASIHNHPNRVNQLLRALDPDLPLNWTDRLTEALVVTTQELPGYLLPFVQMLEGTDEGSFALFRKQRYIHELSDFPSKFHQPDKFHVRGSQDGECSAWKQFEKEGAQIQCSCDSEVLALQGFTGPPRIWRGCEAVESAYTLLFKAAERHLSASDFHALLRTQLMVTTTQFKWLQVSRRVRHRLRLYMLHMLLAAIAFVVGSIARETEHVHSASWIEDAFWLDIMLMVSNSWQARHEIRQVLSTHVPPARSRGGVIRARFSAHFDDPWNWLDLSRICAVYFATAVHFGQTSNHVYRIAASLAMLLNSFGLLQLLRPFEGYGALIKIMTAIVQDIQYFVVVLLLLLTGFSVSFCISMPDNQAFAVVMNGTSDGYLGPVSGIVTGFLAILGSFDSTEYTNIESVAMFLFFLFLVVIVMLNMLIAIMSDTCESPHEI